MPRRTGFSVISPVLFEPKEGADPARLFELHLEAATRHDARRAAPAGFVVEIDAVHVETFAHLFDLALFARVSLR